MTPTTSHRVASLVVALGLLAGACGATAQPESGSAPSSTQPVEVTSTVGPTAVTSSPPPETAATSGPTSSTVPTDGGQAAAGTFECTEILGFSQAGSETNGGWFTVGGFESLPGIDDGAWQLRWRSSAEAIFWIDPSFDGWRDGRLISACDGDPVDRVVLFFLHRSRDVAEYAEPIRDVAEALALRYPDLRQVVIEPMVGGPGEQLCTVPSRGGTVFSTEAHRWVDAAVAEVADGFIVAGASPEVETCEQFVDKPGHLSPDGAAAVAEWMAAYYGS